MNIITVNINNWRLGSYFISEYTVIKNALYYLYKYNGITLNYREVIPQNIIIGNNTIEVFYSNSVIFINYIIEYYDFTKSNYIHLISKII